MTVRADDYVVVTRYKTKNKNGDTVIVHAYGPYNHHRAHYTRRKFLREYNRDGLEVSVCKVLSI